MLMTIAELRAHVQTDETDETLEARLSALELLIRKCTNNPFQQRGSRVRADMAGGRFLSDAPVPFAPGDTVMVSESARMPGALLTVKEAGSGSFTVEEPIHEENGVLVTKVAYPMDVKLGAAGILKWQLKNEAANSGDASQKDVQSETLSRYSVTYASDATESDLDAAFGVPKKHVAFLKHHKKARF